MKLAIVGGGVAGVAAAHTALAAGAEVELFHAAPGASALYSGALDLDAGSAADPAQPSAAPAVIAELTAFADALGWRLAPCVIATAQGNARHALGRDAALLDLSVLAGKRVGVADLERDDWDAALLARSYQASPWARQSATRFEAIPVAGLKNGSERRIAPFDLAALHDQPERSAFLAAALKAAPARPDAWLLGPWLGVERALSGELAEQSGVPVGEAASQLGGAAGARFERARERFFAGAQGKLGARVTRVTRVEPRGSGYALHAGAEELGAFAAVVLAIGGMAAGGVALAADRSERGAAFRLSLEAPVAVELDGRLAEASSLASIDFVAHGVGLVERVGVAASRDGAARGAPGLFVAGDAVAGRARGALSAASSGVIAAQGALAYANGGAPSR